LLPVILDLLNRDHRQYQFAPVLSAADLCLPGLSLEDFPHRPAPDGTPAACVALWDQSVAKADDRTRLFALLFGFCARG